MDIKICHVTSVHPPMDTRIFWKECLSLSKKYNVCLIAANTQERIEHGIKIYNVDLPNGRFCRQFFLKRVLKKMIEVDADIYHFHDPELLRIGVRMIKYGKKIIFDSHEDVPMQILCKEYLPDFTKRTISALYSRYEKYYMKRYDAIVSVTPSIVERLTSVNPNTYMITNYPVLENFVPTIDTTQQNNNICFAGGVAFRYMHETIIKAIEKTHACYLLAGPSYPGYLDKLKNLSGWKQVNYLGVVRYDQVYDIYRKSVAGIVILDYIANVGYHRGTLGVLKLFKYMMAGIPVIATDFDLCKEIVEGCECGICVNPHDIDAIANAINFFVNNPEAAKRMGMNGRKAVEEKYNWATQEVILFDMYEKLL